MPAAVLQRNERVEAARFVLQRAEPVEVVDAVFPVFDMPVQDRRIGRNPDPVRFAVHRKPRFGTPFLRADPRTDRFVENLGAAAGNRLHAGFLEQCEAVVRGQSRLVDHIGQFDRRERLDRSLRQNPLYLPDQIGIIIDVVLRMHSADDVNLGSPAIAVRFHLREDLLFRIIPRVGSSRRSPVRTEPAVENADIGRLNVEIAVIIDLAAAFTLLDPRGQQPQQRQRRTGQHRRFVAAQALRTVDLFDQRLILSG